MTTVETGSSLPSSTMYAPGWVVALGCADILKVYCIMEEPIFVVDSHLSTDTDILYNTIYIYLSTDEGSRYYMYSAPEKELVKSA